MALPDALVALWLELLADGVARPRPRRGSSSPPSASRVSATATWFLRVVFDRVQRRFRDQRRHRARGARRPPAGLGRDHRAPRAARVPRPPRRCCATRCSRSTTCSCRCSRRVGWLVRLGVTVVLLGVDRPGAGPARRCSPLPDRARRRRGGRGVERAVEESRRAARPPGPPPVRARHDRAARQGGPRHRHRRPQLVDERRAAWEQWYDAGRRASAGRRALWHTLAWAVFGAALRRRDRARRRRARRAASATSSSCSPPAAGSRQYVGAAVGELGFLRGIWLDSSQRLAWLEDYAGGHRRATPTSRCPSALDRRHPLRARLVPLPGHRPPRARRRRPHAARRRGGRGRRRERRRQDRRS